MANQEHLDLLKQGVEHWNEWRQKHQNINPDFSGAALNHADLNGADLRGANLNEANLFKANLGYARLNKARLNRANLSDANLSDTTLDYADLNGADLRGANLTRASLIKTNLRKVDLNVANLNDANLSDANLFRANFNGTDLHRTNLGRAKVFATIFDEVDLRETKGLTEISYEGRCTVQLHTVLLPPDGNALHFLRGTGIPDAWIEIYRATNMLPIQYHSCFISYAHQDEILARRLYADLQDHGVRCWFAPEDMKIGDKIRASIDEAIHLQDKLLLLLSEHALASIWVGDEVESALEKERRQQREMLFPVRLDEQIMETTQPWAAKLRRTHNIGDFTRWTDPMAYQQAFERLLRDLKAESDTKGETGGQSRTS